MIAIYCTIEEISNRIASRMIPVERHPGDDISCIEGGLDGTRVILVVDRKEPAGLSEIKSIITRRDITTLIHIDGACPIVPYLQHGDMVVADSLIKYNSDGPSGLGNSPLNRDDRSKSPLDQTLMSQVMKTYETLFFGRSNRPQLIRGRVVTTENGTADKKALAKLQRLLGGMAVDRNGAMVEDFCRSKNILLLLLRVIIDPDDVEGHPETDSGLKLAPDQVTELIVHTIATPQPVATFS